MNLKPWSPRVLKGVVRKDTGRGKEIGYPTANIDAGDDTPEGIYIGLTTIDGKEYPSAIFVGAPATFHEYDKKAESYILDFDAEIYGKEITIKFLHKIRDNKKFHTVDQLKKQIGEDVRIARHYFSSQK